MKIETNKDVFFESLKTKDKYHCESEESFSEILEQEMKEPVSSSSLVYIEKRKPYLANDILDIIIDL